jgi:hypothetical protein
LSSFTTDPAAVDSQLAERIAAMGFGGAHCLFGLGPDGDVSDPGAAGRA